MFTGIVTSVGTVQNLAQENKNLVYNIACDPVFPDVVVGESIAINGCCQTVEAIDQNLLSFTAIPETLAITNLADFEKGQKVNLERALAMGDRLGGHIVQGHVEHKAVVSRIIKEPGVWDIEIEFINEFIIPKGSICVDGISLTIQETTEQGFRVQIIPETIRSTTIETWYHGYQVNLETDYLLKSFDHIQTYRQEKPKKEAAEKVKKKKSKSKKKR